MAETARNGAKARRCCVSGVWCPAGRPKSRGKALSCRKESTCVALGPGRSNVEKSVPPQCPRGAGIKVPGVALRLSRSLRTSYSAQIEHVTLQPEDPESMQKHPLEPLEMPANTTETHFSPRLWRECNRLMTAHRRPPEGWASSGRMGALVRDGLLIELGDTAREP